MDDIESDPEARLRRALGLLGKGAPAPDRADRQPQFQGRPAPDRHSRRFVRDGDVPVVVVNARRNHDGGSFRQPTAPAHLTDAGQAALEAERAARTVAERSLDDAQKTIRDLQTRLAHAELALRAATDHADAAKAEAEALRTALREQAAREQAGREPGAGRAVSQSPARASHRRTSTRPADHVASDTAFDASKPRKVAIDAGTPGPKPVKWWLKSRRTKG